MQISPRYDDAPALDVACEGDTARGALVGQRRRMLATLGTLSDEQWASPTRCAGWTVQDVVAHLVGTDQFWAFAFAAGLRGEPTRVLVGFDPVATPAQMVGGMRDLAARDVLAQFSEKVDELEATLANLDAAQWELPAEAPPGHLRLRIAVLHALWDGWVHERDIMIPLGLTPTEDDVEIDLALRYVAGLSPAFVVVSGGEHSGTLTVKATEPSLSLCVAAATTVRVYDGDADGPCVSGRAVDLIEGLSQRADLVHNLAANDRWFVEGLAQVFDLA
ncbi:MAG: hypothetical protein QOJ00_155 [Actinomycetota bacterium]|jgi:uncharacterized protein (TIGR03083 family)